MPIINQNYGGGSLAPLISPALPTDVVAGKRYYDDNATEQMGTRINSEKLIIERYTTTALGNYINTEVTQIGSYAFAGMQSIKTYEFPNVTTIKDRAFYKDYAIETINVPMCTTIKDSTFESSAIKEFYSSNVATLGSYCFSSASALTKIKIENCTSIGMSCFNSARNLLIIDFRGRTLNTVPTASANICNGVNANCKIVVPDSLYDSWIIATNWATYASYIVKESEYSD